MMRGAATVAESIAYYDGLLATTYFQRTADELSEALTRRDLTWLGRPVCRVLRPYFVSHHTLHMARHAAAHTARLIGIAATAASADGRIRDDLGLAAGEREASPSRGGLHEIVGRLDGFVTPDGEVQFIEYNPSPGAVLDDCVIASLYRRLTVMKEFARRYPIQNSLAWPRLFGMLAPMAARLAVRGLTVIWSGQSVDTPADVQLKRDIDAIARFVRPFGVRFHMASPDDLRYEGRHVYAGATPVRNAYVTDWDGLCQRLSRDHAFWAAAEAGRIRIINTGTFSNLRGNKAVFALLSDPAFEELFDSHDRTIAARHVPWTRVARERCTTGFRGERVDLLPFAHANREMLVLKPAESHGGQGVVLGWTTSDAEWTQALERARTRTCVLQRRVPCRREQYPVAGNNRLDTIECITDLNVFVWNMRQAAGFMARVSEGPMLNLSSGVATQTAVYSLRGA